MFAIIMPYFIYRKVDKAYAKYYNAIRWNIGAEMQSWLCSQCMFTNFIIAGIFLIRFGSIWFVVYSIAYFLLCSFFICPGMNPYLFLRDRAAAGDFEAICELEHIEMLRRRY